MMARIGIPLIGIGIVVASAALVGCKKKPAEDGRGSAGSGSAVVEAPKFRASEQPLPALPPLELAADPKRDAKIALGHTLFFDKRLSGANDRACYSCHQNEDGNGGHDPLAVGSGDKVLTRHSPVIWNVAYFNNSLYWDGRAKDLVANAKGAWGKGNMGGGDDPALDKKAAELAKIAGYKTLFEAAFPGVPVTALQVEQALAEYESTLICKDTKYDLYQAGDKAALTDQQQKGLDVFMGKGGCLVCHAPPFFSSAMGGKEGVYFNTGVGTAGDEAKVDVGRQAISHKEEDWAAFKPPSLRNVTKSAPYFHDGSVAKLEDAVKQMAKGGIDNKNKHGLLLDRKLTDAEIADVIAFLGGLDCPGKLEPPATMP